MRRPQQLTLDSARAGADFSDDGLYRYRLWRSWGSVEAPTCLWVMLNPSTADARADDPTITRCSRRARDWGYGGISVVNLFAYRATDPKLLRAVDDPIGPLNDAAITSEAAAAALIICAWGEHGKYRDRAAQVLRMLEGAKLYSLGRNRDGTPSHPLYIPYHEVPNPFPQAPPWTRPRSRA